MARMLLERGAGLSVRDELGDQAINSAVRAGSVEMLDLILDFEPPLNDHNGLGQTALLMAVEERVQHDIVACLLNAGCDVHIKSPKTNATALHHVWTLPTARLLLSAGARVDVADHIGSTPLHALFRRQPRSCDLVLWGQQELEIARALLEAGADPSTRDHNGFDSLLVYSTKRMDARVVELLLDYGSDPELVDSYGKDCFSMKREDVEVLDVLLPRIAFDVKDRSAMVHRHLNYYKTLIHVRSPAMVSWMVKQEIDPNFTYADGNAAITTLFSWPRLSNAGESIY